jgi:aspartate/methionine/tyrosine aminotransferase
MAAHSRSDLIAALRPTAAALPTSGISTVFAHGLGKPGLIPLWAGEGDMPTPPFIADAASKALLGGETFYTYQRGLPPLREALAAYHTRHYKRAYAAENFFVTGGGMQAIQLAFQMTVGAGDEVLVPTPSWPNFRGAVETTGAKTVSVPMRLERDGWVLDLDQLFAAVTPRTRAIVINSPANPSGWTASQRDLATILDFTRKHGLWIIADEIYGHFYFAGGRTGESSLAPSLQHLITPDDRVLFAQTFSKNWAMTGWRIGWLQAPAALGPTIENHVQYNTSGVAAFMQRGAIAALNDGDAFLQTQVARARQGMEIVTKALAPLNQVRYVQPAGAFYAFFGIDGMTDSLAAALRLIDEANVGLAPGTAFGEGAEPYFRVCFLRSPEQLQEAMHRLSRWISTQQS